MKYIFIFLFSLLAANAFSQSFEDWKKQRDASFKAFKDERDKEFSDFLKKRWEDFSTFRGKDAYEEPKPDNLPKYDEKTAPKPTPRNIPIKEEEKPKEQPKPTPPAPKPTPTPEPEPEQDFPELPEFKNDKKLPQNNDKIPQNPTTTQASVNFFDLSVALEYDKKYPISITTPINEANIAAYWDNISGTDFKPLIDKLLQYKDKAKLNEYGYYLLVRDVSKKINTTENDVNLFCWFILIKSGYRCKIGFSDNVIYLLLPFDGMVYAMSYFTLDNRQFFCVAPALTTNARLYIYAGDYPGATKNMSLNVVQKMEFANKNNVRNLKFNYKGKEYTFNIGYDESVVKYYYGYPQADFTVYFNSQVSSRTENDLLSQLRPHIEGKSEYDAVSFLLAFTQFSFDYQTDDEQFKREKPLFVEETIRYPYSDCEDRSIMFGYLVRKLVGLDVVAVHYPGHLATAVCFNENVTGDYFLLDNRKFVVADPTYIGAPIGLQMPQFIGEKDIKLVRTNRLSKF